MAKARTTFLLLALGCLSLVYLPGTIQSVYTSIRDWRFKSNMTSLSHRLDLAEKIYDAAALDSALECIRPELYRSARKLFDLAQEASFNGDYRSAWKLLERSERDIALWELWNHME